MSKYIGIIVCLCLSSLYFFPVTFIGMPSNINSKLLMAVIGLPVLLSNLSKSFNGKVGVEFISGFGLACGVSLSTYLSVALNSTQDYTYVTYVASMAVWTSAAYLLLKAIKRVHGYLDVKLIIWYLMSMCALQCVLAIAIDLNADVQQFVDRYYSEAAFFHAKKRMYGFGCGLDVAGSRFSAVLIMIACLLYKGSASNNGWTIALYIICFIIISVIGNMIGRTTTVGMVLGALVIIYSFFTKDASPKYIKLVVGLVAVFTILAIILYKSDTKWQDNLEFGFEGFFSLVEKGKWDVHSNEMLKDGFIYPDNIKTWLIGDGYFEEPLSTNPYYVGPDFYGYYMGTDSGYSRFLFYFGALGLLMFAAFFINIAAVCAKYFSYYGYMFWLILFLNFLVWIKVSTDIYVTLAPFFCLVLMDRLNQE